LPSRVNVFTACRPVGPNEKTAERIFDGKLLLLIPLDERWIFLVSETINPNHFEPVILESVTRNM